MALRSRFCYLALVLVMGIVFLISPETGLAGRKAVIKLATLAPEGSAWTQVINKLDVEIREKTEQRVGLRIYAGGVLGDESDMLRKLHIGQIQGAFLSSSGLSALFAEMDVVQIPFLFDSYQEVDFIMSKLEPVFKKGFAEKGYELLGWTEGGFVRLFTIRPVVTLEGLQKSKVWTWTDAPMTNAIFDEADVTAIPLSLPDVLVGLQTGKDYQALVSACKAGGYAATGGHLASVAYQSQVHGGFTTDIRSRGSAGQETLFQAVVSGRPGSAAGSVSALHGYPETAGAAAEPGSHRGYAATWRAGAQCVGRPGRRFQSPIPPSHAQARR